MSCVIIAVMYFITILMIAAEARRSIVCGGGLVLLFLLLITRSFRNWFSCMLSCNYNLYLFPGSHNKTNWNWASRGCISIKICCLIRISVTKIWLMTVLSLQLKSPYMERQCLYEIRPRWPAMFYTVAISVVLEPLQDCSSVSEVTWKDIGKIYL